MIDQLLKESGSLLLVPLAMIVAGFYLTKGFYGLHRSRSQDRKDFLDLWAKADKSDDLWLQVAIRHIFGENLPSSVIRHLMVQPQASQSLGDMAFAWPLLDMNETSGELKWRAPRHFSPRIRRIERMAWLTGYVLLAALGFGSVWLAVIAGKSLLGAASWILAFEMACFAFWSLMRSERLHNANIDVPRWTAKLRWEGGGCNTLASSPSRSRRSKKRRV